MLAPETDLLLLPSAAIWGWQSSFLLGHCGCCIFGFSGSERFSCCLRLEAVGTALAVGLAGFPSFPYPSEVA